MSKLLASATLIVGLVTTVLALLAAFGVPISPDQHEAIIAVTGAVLAIAGIYFHPDIPIGPQAKP